MRRKIIFGVLVFLLSCFFVPKTLAWFDEDWTYRMPVVVNNSLNASNLINYQVKISLTSSNADFWSHVKNDGSDIRILDSDDLTADNFWLKSFDYTNKTAVIWVKLPQILASSQKTIYLYYGNSSAASLSSQANTMKSSPNSFWTKTYNSGVSTTGAIKTALLSNGDIVVVGNYVNAGNTDWLVRRYNNNGDLIWEKIYASGGVDNQAYDVAVDSNNNIIVVGYRNLADRDWYIRKYDSNGNVLWSKSYDFSSGIDSATAVAVDSNNNVIVTGYRADGGDQDWHTKKFNSAGEEIWNINYDSGAGSEIAQDVAVDSNNNIIVVGNSAGSGTRVFYIIKYSANLEEVWSKSYEKGTNPSFMAVDVDSSNNIITGGFYTETNRDWLVRKYDSSGSVVWSRLYDSGNGDDTLFDLAVDSQDNAVAVGSIAESGGVLTDWMFRKYDNNGEVVWTEIEDIDRVDLAAGIAFDASDDFVICGWYAETTDLNWRIKRYGERLYSYPEPSASFSSQEKISQRNFEDYIRFDSDSENIKYYSSKNNLSLMLLRLPTNPEKYWVRIKKIKKYPNFLKGKKAVKYYWQVRTNLYKLKGKKPMKLRMYFNYTHKNLKKNKIKEKNIRLFGKSDNYVKNWIKRKAVLNKKNNYLKLTARKFSNLNNWYAIMSQKTQN